MASKANDGESPPFSVPQIDRRKTKSAEMDRSLSHGGDSMNDLRPTTSCSVVSSSSLQGSRSNGKTKKRAQVQRATVDTATSSSTETLLAGWGDFDSDRLFRNDPLGDQTSSELRRDGRGVQFHMNVHDGRDGDGDIGGDDVGMEASKTAHDDQDVQRRSIQQQRVEELTRRGSKLVNQGAPREPPKQVLRQRTLTVMELEAPEPVVDTTFHTNTTCGSSSSSTSSSSCTLQRGSSFKKPLVSHRRANTKKALNASETTTTYLPTIKKGPAAATSMAATVSPRSLHGLFGPQIDDSLDARALVFARLLPVWRLMSSRGSHAASTSGSGGVSSDTESSTHTGITLETKSPFECSMVLMKICKTIGISLSSSPAPDVWSSVRRYPGETGRGGGAGGGGGGGGGGGAQVNRSKIEVDFESFSDFVVRNAVQPTLHHFRLDRNMDEYLHTLDTVVHSLLVRTTESETENGEGEDGDTQTQPSWRLRELSEIQAVLPHWKKGILAVQKQHPLVKLAHSPTHSYGSPDGTAPATTGNHSPNDDNDNGCYQTAIVSAEEIAGAACLPTTSTSTSHATTFTTGSSTIASLKKLPASEARAQQDANIRRKIQLRQSWQPRLVLASDHHQHGSEHHDRDADLDGRADALGSCLRVEAAALPFDPTAISNQPTSTSTTNSNNQDNLKGEENQEPQEEDDPVVVEPRLLCGACSSDDHEATLWCSACFAVYCDACWTATHHSVVDTSLVTHNHERNLPMPSARPLQTTRVANNHAPPVEMLYLPTKPLAVGKRARGFVSRVQSRATNQQDQDSDQSPASDDDGEDDPVSDTEGSLLTRAFSSHAILPALKPPCQRQSLLKSNKRLTPSSQSTPQLVESVATTAPAPSSMDSTANLLKALMLGTASSASILGSSSCPSNTSSTTSTGISINKRVYKDPVKRKKLHPAAVTFDANALFQR